MPEAKANTEAKKSKTIFSISKEVNRQSSEVLEYLKRINIEVGGIMSKVDDSVYRKILGHFKSDIEEAEKHKQKLLEFQKKHKSIEFSEIEEELIAKGYGRKGEKAGNVLSGQPALPYKKVVVNGWEILVGRSAAV